MERVTIETGGADPREQAARDFKFNPESQKPFLEYDSDAKAKSDLEAISQGKERYNDDEFLKQLAQEIDEYSQELFNLLMKFNHKKLSLLSSFLSRKGADFYSIRLVDDREKLLELLNKYLEENDPDKLKPIEKEIEQIPDL